MSPAPVSISLILAQTVETPGVMDWVGYALGALVGLVLVGAVCLLVIYGTCRLVRRTRYLDRRLGSNGRHGD